MKKLLSIIFIVAFGNTHAVVYDAFEIEHELNQLKLHNQTHDYLTQYFTSKTPDAVVDELIATDMLPLHKEFILNQLLIKISQQPPQDFFRNFINRMKTFPVMAEQAADEGPLPIPIFNINTKAHGIENIWLAYTSEQRFNQLFLKSIPAAINAAHEVIALNSRPQWLGLKNSISHLNQQQSQNLVNHLLQNIKNNTGLDRLISHVGLAMKSEPLVRKALASNQKSIREYTLRKTPEYFDETFSKQLLMEQARNSIDRKFSISLLHTYSDNLAVSEFLIQQLNDKETAGSAAFSLSQFSNESVLERLVEAYNKSSVPIVQNHILLALKLNNSETAQFALEKIAANLSSDSKQAQWLNSFKRAAQ